MTFLALKLTHASGCKLLFIASDIGKFSNKEALKLLSGEGLNTTLDELQEVILVKPSKAWKFRSYDELVKAGETTTDNTLSARMRSVDTHDVCNLQFTSGTTGSPKAAMLTHR
jgi:long-chain acyl-CoA synthetase